MGAEVECGKVRRGVPAAAQNMRRARRSPTQRWCESVAVRASLEGKFRAHSASHMLSRGQGPEDPPFSSRAMLVDFAAIVAWVVPNTLTWGESVAHFAGLLIGVVVTAAVGPAAGGWAVQALASAAVTGRAGRRCGSRSAPWPRWDWSWDSWWRDGCLRWPRSCRRWCCSRGRSSTPLDVNRAISLLPTGRAVGAPDHLPPGFGDKTVTGHGLLRPLGVAMFIPVLIPVPLGAWGEDLEEDYEESPQGQLLGSSVLDESVRSLAAAGVPPRPRSWTARAPFHQLVERAVEGQPPWSISISAGTAARYRRDRGWSAARSCRARG